MMTAEPGGPPEQGAGRIRAGPEEGTARIRAVDAARGTALIGMMAVHIGPRLQDGEVSTSYLIASGRASALFAILAGVGIALASGGPVPHAGAQRARARRAVATRAAFIAAVGLFLGGQPGPVAVILPYYGVLFLAALPVIGWPARRLAVAAAGWVLLAPAASHLLRLGLQYTPDPAVSWTDLLEPVRTARDLLLTGYYPVLTWVGYLLAGMAVGRSALARGRTARRLLAGGTALALVGWGVGQLTVRLAGGPAGLAATLVPTSTAQEVEVSLRTSLFGTAPTTSWWWLGVAAPHSGTGPDLVHTGGVALAVLGAWLLLEPRIRLVALPLVATGSMTLTLYSAHVLALGLGEAAGFTRAEGPLRLLLVHTAVALVVATAWGSPKRRGPLEQIASDAAMAVAGPPAASSR